MKKIFFLMLTLLIVSAASMNAQVTIGSDQDPHAGAILDLQSTTLGLKLPTVSLKDASLFQLAGDSTTAIGIIVYNTNPNTKGGKGVGLYNWSGFEWKTEKPDDEPCPETVTDIDGNVYEAKQFGGQCWMTTNLRVTRTPEGFVLDSVKLNGGFFGTADAGVTVGWNGSQATYTPDINSGTGATYTENGVLHENEDWDTFAAKFGFYYSQTNAMEACPTGWHLPTIDEFAALSNWSSTIFYPGYTNGPAGKLKANNYNYICRDNETARNWGGIAPNSTYNTKFYLLPNGRVNQNNYAGSFGETAFLWTSSRRNDIPVMFAVFRPYNGWYSYANWNDYQYYGVRCLKN
jgi:uncharacterized protein (TIGR02145 family)